MEIGDLRRKLVGENFIALGMDAANPPRLEMILHRVPSARVVVTAVRDRHNEQRITEFLQIIQQVLFPI